jgi:hypothetical protein
VANGITNAHELAQMKPLTDSVIIFDGLLEYILAAFPSQVDIVTASSFYNIQHSSRQLLKSNVKHVDVLNSWRKFWTSFQLCYIRIPLVETKAAF